MVHAAATPFTLYVLTRFVPGDEDNGYQRFPFLDIDREAEGHDCIFRNFKASNLHAFYHEILSLPCLSFLRSCMCICKTSL
jgi:hypothetical protein